MSVSYQFNEQHQKLEIAVDGHFNFTVVTDFRSIYTKIEQVNKIIIDFENADMIDSSGLGILLYMHKHFKCKRDEIELINCNAAITKTFNMAQFRKLFTY